MSNIVKTQIHISEVKQGMTVEVNGEMLTVGKKNIKYCEFMGWSLFGDGSKRTITRIQFLVPTSNGLELRY